MFVEKMSNIIEVEARPLRGDTGGHQPLPEGARIARLSYGVGVPVDRIKLLVEKLCTYGLARKSPDEEGVSYGVTPRGLEFLDTFWKMKGFLEEFDESGAR